MKKYYYFAIGILFSLFTLACSKETEIESINNDSATDDEFIEITITGALDKDILKTAYDDSGKMTWVSGDQIALIVNNNGTVTNQNRYSLGIASLLDDGRTAVFSTLVDKHQVTSGWLSTGFAVYPTSISQINSGSGYDKPFVKLPYSVGGDKSSIVLVGTPDNDDPSLVNNFLFKTAVSVLKVTLENIPANAAELRLCTNSGASYPVDGDFSLVKTNGVVTISNSNYYGWGEGYQSVSITDGVEIASRDFYFNLPVADYPGQTLYLQLRDGSGNQIMKRTINNELKMVRNQCLEIPVSISPVNEVSVGGDVQTPRVVWAIDGKQFRFAVNQSSTLDLSSFPDGFKFTNNTGAKYTSAGSGFPVGYDMTALSPNPLSESGLFYLHYVILNNETKPDTVGDDNVIKYGSIPFYYLSGTDKDIICGTYGFTAIKALTLNNRSAWTDLNSNNATYVNEGYTDAHMIIEPSNDITQGTIMISNFLDFGCNGVTNKSITEEKLITNNNHQVNFQGTYAAGQPLYGTFNNSNYLLAIQATNPLFLLDGVKYYLRHVQAQYNYFNFETSYDSSNVTLTYGSSSGICIVSENQILSSGSYSGSSSTVIFGNVKPVASRTR